MCSSRVHYVLVLINIRCPRVTDNVRMCCFSIQGLCVVKQARMVINFEFPEHMADYIHRAGRLGRVGSGSTGVVLSFIQFKWDVELVQKIEVSSIESELICLVYSYITAPRRVNRDSHL